MLIHLIFALIAVIVYIYILFFTQTPVWLDVLLGIALAGGMWWAARAGYLKWSDAKQAFNPVSEKMQEMSESPRYEMSGGAGRRKKGGKGGRRHR